MTRTATATRLTPADLGHYNSGLAGLTFAELQAAQAGVKLTIGTVPPDYRLHRIPFVFPARTIRYIPVAVAFHCPDLGHW